MWLLPMTLEFAGSNVTNGALLKTWGPCSGFHVASSLIQVHMQLWLWCVANEKGLFGVCLEPCWKKAVLMPRKLHLVLKF